MKTTSVIGTVVVAASVMLAAPSVWAGCGCDHPAPCPAPVLPAFASPGDAVLLTGTGFSTEKPNTVVFGAGKERLTAEAVASDPEHIKLRLPEGERKGKKLQGHAGNRNGKSPVGPAAISVLTPDGQSVNYTEDEFTLLGSPLVLEEGEGQFIFPGVTLAVDTSGVLNVPLDISRVTSATAFAVYLDGLALEFESDDILVYNKQGYNLNLFTLDVDGVEKEWGAWYPPKALTTLKAGASNIFTYWRHDFVEYNEAHAPGGQHDPLVEGDNLTLFHPDGTVHVDHGQLNVAVSGTVKGRTLPGGSRTVTVHVFQLQTEDPDIFSKLSKKEWADLMKHEGHRKQHGKANRSLADRGR